MPDILNHHKIVGLPRPTIFAHRGASAFAPENTLAAFKLAVQQHAHAIELDVKLSADRQVVVIHDQTVDRTTNGTGRVDRLTLEELQKLDASSHFDSACKGERIPSLAQVFETLGDQILINIELKNIASPTDDLPDKVVELVRKFALGQSIYLSSFNPIALLRLHRSVPEVPLGLLAPRGVKGAISRSWLRRLIPHQGLHPSWKNVNHKLVEDNHRYGCRVYPFTVNDVTVMQNLFKIGVDGLYTDNPVLALQLIAELNQPEISPPTTH